jgi:hypothetical protein
VSYRSGNSKFNCVLLLDICGILRIEHLADKIFNT